MPKDTFFSLKKTLNCAGRPLDLSSPVVMGIINATPDSFYKKSRQSNISSVVAKAGEMLEQGAAIIDCGGYSSRPGAPDIHEEEERKRIIPAIKAISEEYPHAIISVDTFRANIAREAMEHGASIINDISGGTLDEKMFSTVGKLGIPYILMHMRGTPQTMTALNNYEDLIHELTCYFRDKSKLLKQEGVKDIILDPGIGFAKGVQQNYEILQKLNYFKVLEMPLLAGISRKSLIWKKLDILPEQSLNGTTVLNTIALMNGAHILRVHDVKEAVEAVKLFKAVFH
ncbi:dihydropteroate synthase [Cytophagaceae bacterium ABcell3]|nr:dihydropteroate synthase [Cytophagaceae bacterium ABcell3]